MFRIVCDPSAGRIELYLTEILSGSLMFVVCLVGVWQRNFEPVVCVYVTTGWELVPSPVQCDLEGKLNKIFTYLFIYLFAIVLGFHLQ